MTVPARLRLLRPLAQGPRLRTAAVEDTQTGLRLAAREVCEPLADPVEALQLLRELRLLRRVCRHPNLDCLVEIFPPAAPTLPALGYATELMDSDLQRVLASQQQLTVEHAQYFTFQLLSGLDYLHTGGVVHRGITPAHLLVTRNCDLRISGLGSAQLERDLNLSKVWEGPAPADEGLSENAVDGLRWYRAPEVLLPRLATIPTRLDIWSAGCILGELLCRRVLFPGRHRADELRLIFAALGPACLEHASRVYPLDDPEQPTEAQGVAAFLRRLHADLEGSLGSLPSFEQEQDFPVAHAALSGLLSFAPEARPSARVALAHPFFAPCGEPGYVDDQALVSTRLGSADKALRRQDLDLSPGPGGLHAALYWEAASACPAIVLRDWHALAELGFDPPGWAEWHTLALVVAKTGYSRLHDVSAALGGLAFRRRLVRFLVPDMRPGPALRAPPPVLRRIHPSVR